MHANFMDFSMNFIAATTDFSTLTHHVPAPYLRKSFTLEEAPWKAGLLICGLGFYKLYLNGKRITKGALAPYISNPDDLIYYDFYDIKEYLAVGENVVGICLGNGFQNNPGGYIWDFEKARFRGAPQVALSIEIDFKGDADTLLFEGDESFRWAPSPIYNDDLRNGEYYDARREQPGWCVPSFDDSGWQPAIKAPNPRGEARLCEAEPIVVTEELPPVSITALEDGYLYDFGANCAGVCRLTVNGTAGQEISLYHGEHLIDGRINMRNIGFNDNDYVQKDIYICKGEDTEFYTPSFTYHGFQYVFVKGLTAEQAVPEALTCLVMNSDLKERGGFSCSDETVNTLQTLTRRSTLANFYYFPTDCPHREKNGWTGDAALSAEHMLLNLNPENSYREWLRNIRKAQRDDGALPGIVPTGGWGYEWGNGPAWDCILIWLPYYTYLYRGNKDIIQENAHAILRYLEYMNNQVLEDGLLAYGLGDWCPPDRGASEYKSPLQFTDTVIGMDMCEKAAWLFGEINLPLHREFALNLYKKLRAAARSRLLNLFTMTAEGNCQTSQAMAIYFNLFEPAEKPEAFRVLLDIIEKTGNHLDTGILGGRVLFHVLAEFGQIDLALRMITQPSFPSYGWWVAQGATSLWEDFSSDPRKVNSHNHHFWGDISHFFIRQLAGICYNPYRQGKSVDICPKFAEALSYAEGYHVAPEGEIRVRWQREESGGIRLDVTVPKGLKGQIKLPPGYVFDAGTAAHTGQVNLLADLTVVDGTAVQPALSKRYWVKKIKN